MLVLLGWEKIKTLHRIIAQVKNAHRKNSLRVNTQ